jgi:hypothetical protein
LNTLVVRLEWASTSAAAARVAVSQWLEGIDCDEDAKHDVVLATSELVTRAVDACVGPPTLSVTSGDGRVRVEVETTEAVADLDLGGPHPHLGTLILQAICLDFGVTASPSSTKMWGELATDGQPRRPGP